MGLPRRRSLPPSSPFLRHILPFRPFFLPTLLLLFLFAAPDASSSSSLSSSSAFFRHLLASIPESRLDANRSVLLGDERVFIPRRIPKLSRAEKRKLLAEQFRRDAAEPPREFYETIWTERQRRRRRNRRQKRHRISGVSAPAELRLQVPHMARRQHMPRINLKLQARNTDQCPEKLDAVAEGFNKHLYTFAGDLVYEVWRDNEGLQQRQAFALRDLFPDGPRRVTAALTNHKSGVTVLLEHRTVYRFRWDKRHQRFYMARNSPRPLPSKVDFVPRVGFQWKDGHLILANHQKFVSYDPFWNLATFSSDKAKEYFPNLDSAMVGVARQGRHTYLMTTAEGKLLVYDMSKHKVELEFPVSLRHFLACLSPAPSESDPTKSP